MIRKGIWSQFTIGNLAGVYSFVVLFAGTLSAHAQGTDCGGLETQMDINQCYGAEFERADAKMQSTYDQLRQKLGPVGKQQLRDSQRGWITFKEGWCKFESAAVEQGSMYPSVISRCLTRLTKEQTQRLTYQLTCSEDVDCASTSEQ